MIRRGKLKEMQLRYDSIKAAIAAITGSLKDLSKLNIKKIYNIVNLENLKNFISGKNLKRLIRFKKTPQTAVILSVLVTLALSGIILLSAATAAVGVRVNGNNIGYTHSMSEAKQAVQEIMLKHSVGGAEVKTDDQIEYARVLISKEKYAANVLSEGTLAASLTPYVDGYGLRIGKDVVLTLPNEQEADLVLAEYKKHFAAGSANDKINSVEIVEKITIVPAKIDPGQLKTTDEALAFLLKGNVSETKYKIQQDDSLWSIARNNDMLVKEIIAGNPGLTEDTVLQLDQQIKIVKVQPYLTVVCKGTRTVNEVVPFDVVTKTDSQIASGNRVVKQEGKDGEKVVTYSYVEQNGSLVEKQVVKEEVTTKPVDQVIAMGPSRKAYVTVATSRGSGRVSGLSWPISGPITSYYGSRWGSFHTGIDIDGVTGQPYEAAASGTVTFAGYDGGYGYCIIIDHGNGVATRYGHSSKLKVHAGQHVSKGQIIGLVGSTGHSTGSHLHFEIIINGSTVNPLNYL